MTNTQNTAANDTISKNKVVAFHYVLTGEDGKKLEESGDEPMVYLHGGYRNILPALEAALEGKGRSEQIKATLPPEQAYGIRTENSIQRVPIKHLLTKQKRLKPGMAVVVNTSEGPRDVVIAKVGKFNVDVDTNHPLAGQSVTFDITIKDIRDAVPEEISHRHAHGWDADPHHHE